MIYKCEKCLKEFNRKCNYDYHIRRIRPCINKPIVISDIIDHNILTNNVAQNQNNVAQNQNNVAQNQNNVAQNQNNVAQTDNKLNIKYDGITDLNNSKEKYFKCNICNIIYKHTQSLTNHKKIKHPNYNFEINKKLKENEEIIQLRDIFLKESLDHKQKIEKLIKDMEEKNKQIENITKISKSKTINNNTTNNNGIINNINIVQFGREDISSLTREEIKKILYERGVDGLLASLEIIHFNDRLPQYKNLRLTNLNSKYIDVHNGKTWIKDDKEKIINETLENHTYNLQQLCEDNNNSKKIKNSIKNLIDDYSNFNNLMTEEKNTPNNKKLMKKINTKKDEVRLFMYNKTKSVENLNNLTDVLDV
jgi:hypothetical protein